MNRRIYALIGQLDPWTGKLAQITNVAKNGGNMHSRTRRILASRKAASGIEYGLAVALVAMFAIVSVESTGTSISNLFGTTGEHVSSINADVSNMGGGYSPGTSGAPEDQAFLSFANVDDAATDTDYTSTGVVAPAGADGALISVSGDASCSLILNGINVGSSSTLHASDFVQMSVHSATASSTTVGCTATTSVDAGAWSVSTPVDTTPDAFSFIDIVSANLATEYTTSNTVTLTGFDGPVIATVTGDAILIVDGDTSGQSVEVNPNQQILVRMVSSSEAGTAKQAEIVVGDTSTIWSITTKIPDENYALASVGTTASATVAASYAHFTNDGIITSTNAWTVPTSYYNGHDPVDVNLKFDLKNPAIISSATIYGKILGGAMFEYSDDGVIYAANTQRFSCGDWMDGLWYVTTTKTCQTYVTSAHRYWRLRFVRATSNSDGIFSLKEVQLVGPGGQ